MQIKPEERAQAIGLGVATVAVFSFGVWRIMSAMHTTSSSDTAQNLVSGQAVPAIQGALPGASSAIGVPSAPGAPLGSITPPTPLNVYGGSAKGTKLDLYADKTDDPTLTADPFKPILPQPGQSAARFQPPVQPVRTALVAPAFMPRTTVMPVMPMMPGSRPSNFSSGPGGSVMTPGGKSPLDDVTLAGVVSGPSSVAVLHIGDRSFELVGGEKLPYGLVLARITDNGIYVRHNGQMMFMEIGKTLRTAMPIRSGSLPSRSASHAMLSSAPLSSRDEMSQEPEMPARVSANEPAESPTAESQPMENRNPEDH